MAADCASAVRLATKDDHARIVEVGRLFFEESGYGRLATYNAGDLLKTLAVVDRQGFALVAGNFDGIAAFLLFPFFFNHRVLLAQEMFWWVNPEHRGRGLGIGMLRRAEAEARGRGASAISMLCLEAVNPDSVAEFYRKSGYRLTERQFWKEL